MLKMGLKGMTIINALARANARPLPERIIDRGHQLRLARRRLCELAEKLKKVNPHNTTY